MLQICLGPKKEVILDLPREGRDEIEHVEDEADEGEEK